MAAHFTVGAGRCCRWRSVVKSWPLVDAAPLRMALTRVMRPADDMHIHGFLTGAFGNAQRAGQCFRVLALPRLPLL